MCDDITQQFGPFLYNMVKNVACKAIGLSDITAPEVVLKVVNKLNYFGQWKQAM